MWVNILNINNFEIEDDRLNLYNKDKFMLAGIDMKQIKSIEVILNLRQVAVGTQVGTLYLYTDNKLGKKIMKEVEKYKENNLDEAINHAEEVYEKLKDSCPVCANEHKQLAEWLKDYKEIKSK